MPANTITAVVIPSFDPALIPPEVLPESAFWSEMMLLWLMSLGLAGAGEGADDSEGEEDGGEGDVDGAEPGAASEGGGAGGDEIGLRGALTEAGAGDAVGVGGERAGGASAASSEAGPGEI